MNLFPILSDTSLSPVVEFIPALVIGFAFGFVLERSGFGNARVLAAQFYLYNMRVFKVMFAAIVTAAVGAALLSSVGLLNLGAVYVPETFYWPHLVGGFLLGVGFIISGYCPGTSVVAAASGNWDGAVTILGVVVGSVLFGELYPLVEDFHLSGAAGTFTLPQLTGLGYPFLVAGLALMAAAAFFGAEKLEGLLAGKLNKVKEPSWSRAAVSGLATLVVGGLAATAVFFAGAPVQGEPVPAARVESVSAVEVARLLVDDPRQLYVADLREKPQCDEGKDRLPYAACFADLAPDLAALSASGALVVYGQGDVADTELPSELAGFPGRTLLLVGGSDAWQSLIVAKEPAPELLAALDAEQKSLVPALHSFFTGTKAKAPAKVFRPKVQRKMKKGGGCS